MDVLRTVPLGTLPIVGFAGSGKTDLIATTILLAIGAAPVIVRTSTHAAASNITARANKLASLAYGKVKEPMPVIVRGFSWKVDELRGKASMDFVQESKEELMLSEQGGRVPISGKKTKS